MREEHASRWRGLGHADRAAARTAARAARARVSSAAPASRQTPGAARERSRSFELARSARPSGRAGGTAAPGSSAGTSTPRRPADRTSTVRPRTTPTSSAGEDHAPEAAEAADHHDDEGGGDDLGAHGRLHAARSAPSITPARPASPTPSATTAAMIGCEGDAEGAHHLRVLRRRRARSRPKEVLFSSSQQPGDRQAADHGQHRQPVVASR